MGERVVGAESRGTTLVDSAALDAVPPEQIPVALAELAAAQTRLVARLLETRPPLRPGEESLCKIEDAARMLGVSVDWLYRHAASFPFTRKVSHRQLRFDVRGIEEHLRKNRRAA